MAGRGAPEGNTNSSKENRLVRETLRRIAVQNPKKLRAACEKLLEKAIEGDVSAFKEFRDTLDGRPNQTVSNPDGSPILPAVSEEQAKRMARELVGK